MRPMRRSGGWPVMVALLFLSASIFAQGSTDGAARIRCEFCGEQYAFEPDEVSALFAATPTGHPPPERVQ